MTFDKRLFVSLFMGFIVSTIVGTLSHELGHYTVAKSMGYEARINFGMTPWYDKVNKPFIDSTYSKYYDQIKNNKDFPDKEKFFRIQTKFSLDSFWILLGGPLQTMLTGTFGLIFLITYKRRLNNVYQLSKTGWLLVFTSLFWLRQTTNLFTGFCFLIMTGKTSYRGDEIRLAFHLGIPLWTIEIVTGIIGAIILLYVILKIIPEKQRLTFILSGLFGGVTGYILWLKALGPILMP